MCCLQNCNYFLGVYGVCHSVVVSMLKCETKRWGNPARADLGKFLLHLHRLEYSVINEYVDRTLLLSRSLSEGDDWPPALSFSLEMCKYDKTEKLKSLAFCNHDCLSDISRLSYCSSPLRVVNGA